MTDDNHAKLAAEWRRIANTVEIAPDDADFDSIRDLLIETFRSGATRIEALGREVERQGEQLQRAHLRGWKRGRKNEDPFDAQQLADWLAGGRQEKRPVAVAGGKQNRAEPGDAPAAPRSLVCDHCGRQCQESEFYDDRCIECAGPVGRHEELYACPGVTTDVYRCARCGADHWQLRFKPLTFPNGPWTHWASCPTNGEPVLMELVEDGGEA